MRKMISLIVLVVFTVVGAPGCGKDSDPTATFPTEVTLNKQANVFGVRVIAASTVPDAKVLHAAHVLAQYLDNDEDGVPDNQLVVDEMVGQNAFLVMFANSSEMEAHSGEIPSGTGQDLHADETHPGGAASGIFDASLEEVFHLVTHAGYSSVYPNIFGVQVGSEISNAMDIARGGYFQELPVPYPASAWYSYSDPTCDYECQGGEYIYWAMTSILGAQQYPGRLAEINHEWKLNTKSKVQVQDVAVHALLTDVQYKFATVLPDGIYSGGPIELIIQKISEE